MSTTAPETPRKRGNPHPIPVDQAAGVRARKFYAVMRRIDGLIDMTPEQQGQMLSAVAAVPVVKKAGASQ